MHSPHLLPHSASTRQLDEDYTNDDRFITNLDSLPLVTPARVRPKQDFQSWERDDSEKPPAASTHENMDQKPQLREWVSAFLRCVCGRMHVRASEKAIVVFEVRQ